MTTLLNSVLSAKNAAEYENLFNTCSSGFIQQSVYWADVVSPLSPDTPYFLISCDEQGEPLAGLSLYYFKTQSGEILTSVPHAGPLGGIFYKPDIAGELKQDIYNSLLTTVFKLAKDLNCISLTVITNPIENDAELYKNTATPNYVFRNFCQVVELETVIDDNGEYNSGRSKYNNDIKRNLEKASENGIYVEWVNDDAEFEAWYEIHKKRHNELNATPLPKELLKNIMRVLKPAGKGDLALVKQKGRIIGGCIFVWHKKIVDAFIMSSESDYMIYGINHALTDFAIKYFRSKGMQWFNWQSCKKNSGVYDFKKRWGSREMEYEFLTWTFEGFDKVFETPIEKLAEEYKWHYLAPFEALKRREKTGVYLKG